MQEASAPTAVLIQASYFLYPIQKLYTRLVYCVRYKRLRMSWNSWLDGSERDRWGGGQLRNGLASHYRPLEVFKLPV